MHDNDPGSSSANGEPKEVLGAGTFAGRLADRTFTVLWDLVAQQLTESWIGNAIR